MGYEISMRDDGILWMTFMADFINKASGRDNIRFFDSEPQALAWLKGD